MAAKPGKPSRGIFMPSHKATPVPAKIIAMKSPDGKVIRRIDVPKQRTRDLTKLTDGEREVQKLLSRGWKFNGKGNGGGRVRSGKMPAPPGWRQVSDPTDEGNEERVGSAFETEELDIDLSDYAEVVQVLSTMQQAGFGNKMTPVGIGPEPFLLAKAMKTQQDFVPYLYWEKKRPTKAILITVDTSPSCASVSPMAKALAKALAKAPALSLEYDENFNGESYSEEVRTKLDNKWYDLVIYLGDTDFRHSRLDRADFRCIALMSLRNRGYLRSYSNSGKDNTYYVHQPLDSETIYYGIIEAKEYFVNEGL